MTAGPEKHYDVIVLGRSLGALTAAALLARRAFTVLVIGQGTLPGSYRVDNRPLRRRTFTMLAATSPVWRRVVVELAQSQTWKRRVIPAQPMMQVLASRMRLELPPDLGLLGNEIARELPELKRPVDELYAELARVNGAADQAFEADAVWPPGTFWERRETNRYAAMLPHVRAEPDADLLVDFPRGHIYRSVVGASVHFATDLSVLPPPFAVARLHGAWTRGPVMLARGEGELDEFLVDRIEAHGGRCELGERAAAIVVRRGAASGIVVDGDDRLIGANFVVTDLDGEAVAALAGGEGIHERVRREWPRITRSVGRFVVSAVVHREGVPDPLGPYAFVQAPHAYGLLTPFLHLQRFDLDRNETLLVAEALLSDRGSIHPPTTRQALLDTLAHELPFLERHLVIADSPHDGLPLWRWDDGVRRVVDRASAGLPVAPERMVKNLEIDPPGYLGLSGEPIRGPVARVLLCGRSVLPALGQEGELLAAWGAARLVTRSDRKKERMRREMWSKVEFG